MKIRKKKVNENVGMNKKAKECQGNRRQEKHRNRRAGIKKARAISIREETCKEEKLIGERRIGKRDMKYC